jgi:hypothetical protein
MLGLIHQLPDVSLLRECPPTSWLLDSPIIHVYCCSSQKRQQKQQCQTSPDWQPDKPATLCKPAMRTLRNSSPATPSCLLATEVMNEGLGDTTGNCWSRT